MRRREVPWETTEKEWICINEYNEGHHKVREFQHASGVLLSVRDTGNGLVTEFERSDAALEGLKKSFNIEPSNFFAAVAGSSVYDDTFRVTVIDKNFFFQNNSVDDDNESADLAYDAMLLLFSDTPMSAGNGLFEIKEMPLCEVWRRLKAVGFVEYDPFTDIVPNAFRSDKAPPIDLDIETAVVQEINRLAGIQQATRPAPAAVAPNPAVSAPPVNVPSATNPVIPPQKSGPVVPNRPIPASPAARRFGQAATTQHSIRETEDVSAMDTTMFTGDDWPPSTPDKMKVALEKILGKHPLGMVDLERLKIGLPMIKDDDFMVMNTLATSFWQADNPLAQTIFENEFKRREDAGLIKKVAPIDLDDLPSLDFL